jgi:hypothetical protein
MIKALSICGEGQYLDFTELNLEVGPHFCAYLDEPPAFAGWLRVALSGEGQPYPFTKADMIQGARDCEAFRRIIDYAGRCFRVNNWQWAVSCGD